MMYLCAGGLTTSQFPVFTIYVQKLCLPSATCRRAWTFESVEGFMIQQNIKKRGRLPTRENCMAMCRAEADFPCRWVTRASKEPSRRFKFYNHGEHFHI